MIRFFDQNPLNLVRALDYAHQRGVAIVAFDIEFGGIALAPVDPHCFLRKIHLGLRLEQLSHTGFQNAALAAFIFFGGLIYKHTRGFQPGSRLLLRVIRMDSGL